MLIYSRKLIMKGVITEVRLTNWKSHANSKLSFLPGTNVLVGVMGAGKSAVLDAISFALFGTFPALSSKKASLDACITNKPEQRGKASVEVDFTAKGKSYTVVREVALGKGTTRSELREGGRLIEGPQTKRVSEEITKILGMDYDLFSRAVYSEQNQLDYFLQIPSGQRKRKIDELLRIDRFGEARKNASALARQFSSEANALRQQLGSLELPDIAKEEKALAAIEDEKARNQKLLLSVRTKLSELEERRATMEDTRKQAGAAREELASISSRLDVHSKAASELKKELEAAGDITAELQHTQQQLKGLAAAAEPKAGREAAKAEQEVAVLNEQLRQAEEKAAEREALAKRKAALEKGEWHKKLETARAERDSLLEKQERCELAIANAEKRIKALAGAGDRCPVCESPITLEKRGELEMAAAKDISDSKALLLSTQKRLSAISIGPIEEKARELDRISAQIEALGAAGDIAKLKQDLSNALARLSSLKEAAKKEQAAIGALQKEREVLSARAKELEMLLEKRGELDAAIREITSLKEKEARLKEKLSKLHFDEGELSGLQAGIRQLSSKAGELESLVSSAERLATEKRRLISEMREREEEAAAMRERIGLLSKAADKMSIFKKSLEDTQVQLREQFVSAVNLGLDEIWGKLYPYADYPRIRLGIEQGDYALQVLTLIGGWANIEGFASGGERSTAALALRIAFSIVLAPQLSWLVLDEPTHNLDSNGVMRLTEAMQGPLPEVVSQIFLITHDDAMEAAATGNLYRLEREKEKDGPTKIVLVSSGKD